MVKVDDGLEVELYSPKQARANLIRHLCKPFAMCPNVHKCSQTLPKVFRISIILNGVGCPLDSASQAGSDVGSEELQISIKHFYLALQGFLYKNLIYSSTMKRNKKIHGGGGCLQQCSANCVMWETRKNDQ